MNAAFFDMDGTLIDSRADLATAVNFTRGELGLEPLAQERVIGCVGCGARYLLENAIPECAGRFDELWPRYLEHYRAHMLDETVLYPGVRTTLEELRDRGWLLGINTNKPAFATRAILDHFGLSRLFAGAVVAGGDCAEMKPSAMPLRECAARMCGHRLSAYDWMVGDNWTDLECARAAGVRSAFCSFGFGQARDSRCTARLSSFAEILRWCKGEDR